MWEKSLWSFLHACDLCKNNDLFYHVQHLIFISHCPWFILAALWFSMSLFLACISCFVFDFWCVAGCLFPTHCWAASFSLWWFDVVHFALAVNALFTFTLCMVMVVCLGHVSCMYFILYAHFMLAFLLHCLVLIHAAQPLLFFMFYGASMPLFT